MKNLNNPFVKSDGTKCSCMEMLQLMLDSDVSEDQKEYFKQHIDHCLPCYKTYDLEMTIKELLKTNCCGNDVPAEVIEQIKKQINQKISF